MNQQEKIVHRKDGIQAEVWQDGDYWHWDLIAEKSGVVLQESQVEYDLSSGAQHDAILAFVRLRADSGA